MKRLLIAVVFAAFVVPVASAWAADGLPGATVRSDGTQAQAERRARYEQWCKDNAEKCREAQARREQCKANPEKCRAEQQARAQERFKKADVNGDSRLSREEAQKGMPALARHFDLIDANKDGMVTAEEIQAARKARAEGRKGTSGSRQADKPA
jgi:TolA-binding protein